MITKSIDFLTKIWSNNVNQNDYVVLATTEGVGKNYRQQFFRINENLRKLIREYIRKNKGLNLYWSPVGYKKPQRRLLEAQESKYLVQDVDEHTNIEKLHPAPSYIYESSPNKYQALWELDRYIEPNEYTTTNKGLAKHLGCDDCFDMVHVYRIPGTINHKYKNKPVVSIPRHTKQIYKPKVIKQIIKKTLQKEIKKTTTKKDDGTATERSLYAKYDIPQQVRDYLALNTLDSIDDRSSVIWYIENSLHEIGMDPNEIIVLVKNSVFNKYKGRPDENQRLKDELKKIISGKIQPKEALSKLITESYTEVLSTDEGFQGWLVKDVWGKASHGIVAGMPKSYKSTVVHDLIVSVASGKPFLEKFEVETKGPVLVVQNENAGYLMKDRTEKIAHKKGLLGRIKYKNKKIRLKFPEVLPITFINQQGFILNNKDHQVQIEQIIKKIKPVLVVFDPLYLMFEGDLSSAQELNPILNWMLKIKSQYNTSIMVIHHYNKGANVQQSGGIRIMGSIVLYGWIESAWYLLKCEKNGIIEKNAIVLEREFRMSGPKDDIKLKFNMGEVGTLHYRIDVSDPSVDNYIELEQLVLDKIKEFKPSQEKLHIETGSLEKAEVNRIVDILIAGKKVSRKHGVLTPKKEVKL